MSLIRNCTICGEQLPAGKVFHYPDCAAMHKAELDDRIEKARQQRQSEGAAGWTRRIKHQP